MDGVKKINNILRKKVKSMSFKMKYTIIQKHLTVNTKRRSGILLDHPEFLVAHDTGNKGSTALGNVEFYEGSNNVEFASAHLFIDDVNIIECIPSGLVPNDPTPAEKAWQVLYDVHTDNDMFGFDSNDCAIGFEYCYGDNINAKEAYKRYLWVMAWACWKLNLNVERKITGHFLLDPARKTDPQSGLMASLGISYNQFRKDLVVEYLDCTHIVEGDDNMPAVSQEFAWRMLNRIWSERYNNKEITDWVWIQKIRSRTLTAGELAFLNTVRDAQKDGLDITALADGMDPK